MRRIAAFSFALALLFGGAAAAQDSSAFTPAEESVEALYEAVLMSSSKLLQEFGPADAALSFSGTFSSSGWSATLTGDYAGQPVALSFSGTFDGSTHAGSFTSSGTYGDGTWTGSGSWSYVQVDPMNLDMSWDSEATIAWPWKLLKPDKHFTAPKRWARSVLPDGSVHVVDSGTYRSTYFGIPFGKAKKQISDWIYPPGGGGGIATVTVSLTDEAIGLTGYADFGSGGVGGKVNLSSAVVKDPVPVEVETAAARKAVD
jgi:hypothetical protein